MNKKKITYTVLTSFILVTMFVVSGYLFLKPGENQDSFQSDKISNSEPVDNNFIRVETESRSPSIEIQGRVRSENRLEIFPEVQGKIILQDEPFREGIEFRKGETIVQLDDEEARLQLYASRSGFQTLITSLMPDIKLDYTDQMEAFERWFDSLHPEKNLTDIPDFNHPQMQLFLTSRGVYDRFYQIKSAENRLEKFAIKAPFSGLLSSAKAEPGQNVGPQTHLGTLIDPDNYILTTTIRRSQVGAIRVGSVVDLKDQDSAQLWQAVVTRINPSVDPRTQTVEIYLEVSGNGIKEGMFLEGLMETDDPQRIAEIPKTALLRTGHVYAVREGVVQQVPVQVVDVEHATVWVSGLEEGENIIPDAGKALGGRIIRQE